MADGGWLKLYRELIEKPIWKCTTSEQKAILITLLCMANHEEKEWVWQGEKYKCQPGQFVTSLKGIAEKAGTSIKNVRTSLKNFEQIYEFSASKSTNKNRLITITNWALYQSKDKTPASKKASNGQASGKQVATNKNDKNDKKERNNIYTPEFELFYSIYPRPENKGQSFKNYNKAIKGGVTHNDLIQAARNYIEAKTGTDKQYLKNSSNFLGVDATYKDYLPGTYKQTKGGPQYADCTGIGLGEYGS